MSRRQSRCAKTFWSQGPHHHHMGDGGWRTWSITLPLLFFFFLVGLVGLHHDHTITAVSPSNRAWDAPASQPASQQGVISIDLGASIRLPVQIPTPIPDNCRAGRGRWLVVGVE